MPAARRRVARCSRNSRWPSGSSPFVDGTPPVRRTHVASATGSYPDTGPPTTARDRSRPRESIHIRHSPTGTPASSTGTVLAHWPVTATATTSSPSMPLVGQAPAGALDHEPPPLLGVLGRGSAGPPSRGDGPVVPPRDLAAGGDQPDLRAAGAQVDGEHEPTGRLGHEAGRGHGLLGVEHVGHDGPDELLDLARQPSGHSAVDRAADSRLARGLLGDGVRHGLGEVGLELLDDARLGSAVRSPPCGSRSGTAGR